MRKTNTTEQERQPDTEYEVGNRAIPYALRKRPPLLFLLVAQAYASNYAEDGDLNDGVRPAQKHQFLMQRTKTRINANSINRKKK